MSSVGVGYVLKVEDVPHLVDKLMPMSHKWEQLGIALSLPVHVREQCRSQSNAISLSNILEEWVKGNGAKSVTLGYLQQKLQSPLVGYARMAQELIPHFGVPSGRSDTVIAATHDELPPTISAKLTDRKDHGDKELYLHYMSLLPPAAHFYLNKMVDCDHGMVNKDLYQIAHDMLCWDSLAPQLGLNEVDVADIKHDHHTAEEQRIAALLLWKQRTIGTYHDLLRVCCSGGDSRTAAVICDIVSKKTDTGENSHTINAAGQGTVAPSISTVSEAQNGTGGNCDISTASKQDTIYPTTADALVAQNTVPLTLRTITLYKWTDENGQPKSLRILDEISSRWTDAGDLLGLSPARLKGIEVYQLRDARSCCRDVLQDWIQDNQGSYPVSWEGLMCLLKDMKLTVVAKELENALRTRNTL